MYTRLPVCGIFVSATVGSFCSPLLPLLSWFPWLSLLFWSPCPSSFGVPAFFVTVTVHVASKSLSTAIALIVVVPSDTAIIFPFFTFATWSLSLAHAAILYVALAGSIVAVKVSSLPASKFKDVLFNV